MFEIVGLTKKYGDVLAVDDLSMTLEPGRVYGFLGPNGAGKSTTMNMITGYLEATSGSVTVNGISMEKNPKEAKKLIGYLPEQPPLYEDMTVREYLEFVFDLKKTEGDKASEVDEVIDQCKLGSVEKRLIRHLSKGFRQRVGIAQAILGKPEIIILDEPTVGLDPAQLKDIRGLIRRLGKDHTVIFSSHILGEVSAVSDHVYIISEGRLVASDSVEELNRRFNGSQMLNLTIDGDGSDIEKLKEIDDVSSVEYNTGDDGMLSVTLHAKGSKDIRKEVLRYCGMNDINLLEISSSEMSLEDIFLTLTKEEKEQQ